MGSYGSPGTTDRLVGEGASTNGLEERRAVPHLVVATHAEGSRGNARIRGRASPVMAIETVDSVVPHVVSVIEKDGLLDELVLPACVGRAGPPKKEKQSAPAREHRKREREAHEAVGCRREERGHRSGCGREPPARVQGPRPVGAAHTTLGRVVPSWACERPMPRSLRVSDLQHRHRAWHPCTQALAGARPLRQRFHL
jgi:hypothetical protein